MGTDPFFMDRDRRSYPFPDPDPDPPFVTRSSLTYPIWIGSPINDPDPANH